MQRTSLWNSFLLIATVAACDSPDDEALLERLNEEEEVDILAEDGGMDGKEGQRDLTLSTKPPPDSGAWAHDGGQHTVCADSLTVYNNGKIGTLTWGATFWIDHWGDGKNHAWGWGNNPGSDTHYWGWVYNGWFC